MTRYRLVVALVVLAITLASPGLASHWGGTCKDCADSAGLAICVSVDCCGGYSYCWAGTVCRQGECFEFCELDDPCIWV